MIEALTHKRLARAGLRPPKTLTVAVTGACNLACSHCWVQAGEETSPGHVPVQVVTGVIGEFAALGGEGVRLTGGEPLCHPQWLELVRFAVDRGFERVHLQTNGTLLDDDSVAALRELNFPGLTIQVSFDGAHPASHDLVRGGGAFDSLMQGMRRLGRAGLAHRVSIFFTEMRHNLQEIPELLKLGDELGVASVATGTLVHCGRAAEEPAAAPEASQYLALLKRHGSDLQFRSLYRKLGRAAALEWRSCELPRGEACTFVENPYLTAQGRLYPCVLCHAEPWSVTGVFDKGLAAALAEGVPVWMQLQQESGRRSEQIAQCRECRHRVTCAGGCLGRAWGSCGDVMAADDRCEIRRAVSR